MSSIPKRKRAVPTRIDSHNRRQENGRPINDGTSDVVPPSPCLFGNIQLAVSVLIALICTIALSCWYLFGGYQSHQATIVIAALGLLLFVVSAVFSCCAFVHLSRVKRVLQQQRDVEDADESLAESPAASPLTYDESARAVHLRILHIQRIRANSMCERPGYVPTVHAELTELTTASIPVSAEHKTHANKGNKFNEEAIECRPEINEINVIVTPPS